MQAAQWTANNSYDRGSIDAAGSSHSDVHEAYLPLPKISKYPPLIETEGPKYVLQSLTGCFYHAYSNYYYFPKSKLYYSGASGAYYRYCPPRPDSQPLADFVGQSQIYGLKEESYFELVAPPLPPSLSSTTGSVDDTSAATVSSTGTTVKSGAVGPKKSFVMSIAVTKTVKSSMKPRVLVDTEEAASPVTGHPASTMAAVISNDGHVHEAIAAVPTPVPIATSEAGVYPGVPVCLLCQRKFATEEQLLRHVNESKLHKENLTKQPQQQPVEQVANDRAQESEVAASFHRIVGSMKRT
jgi:hypothetical protein